LDPRSRARHNPRKTKYSNEVRENAICDDNKFAVIANLILLAEFRIKKALEVADTLQPEDFHTLEAYAEVLLHGQDNIYMAK